MVWLSSARRPGEVSTPRRQFPTQTAMTSTIVMSGIVVRGCALTLNGAGRGRRPPHLWPPSGSSSTSQPNEGARLVHCGAAPCWSRQAGSELNPCADRIAVKAPTLGECRRLAQRYAHVSATGRPAVRVLHAGIVCAPSPVDKDGPGLTATKAAPTSRPPVPLTATIDLDAVGSWRGTSLPALAAAPSGRASWWWAAATSITRPSSWRSATSPSRDMRCPSCARGAVSPLTPRRRRRLGTTASRRAGASGAHRGEFPASCASFSSIATSGFSRWCAHRPTAANLELVVAGIGHRRRSAALVEVGTAAARFA